MTPRFRALLTALADLVICALQGRDRIVLRALWGAAISPPGFPRRDSRGPVGATIKASAGSPRIDGLIFAREWLLSSGRQTDLQEAVRRHMERPTMDDKRLIIPGEWLIEAMRLCGEAEFATTLEVVSPGFIITAKALDASGEPIASTWTLPLTEALGLALSPFPAAIRQVNGELARAGAQVAPS